MADYTALVEAGNALVEMLRDYDAFYAQHHKDA